MHAAKRRTLIFNSSLLVCRVTLRSSFLYFNVMTTLLILKVEGLRDERSGVGPIISSAMVAAIGTGDAFSDFAAWLGLVPKQISTGDSHHPRQDIETRQSLPVLTTRGRRL